MTANVDLKGDIPPDCTPANEDETVVEYLAGPDSLGRYTYCLYWLIQYIPGKPDPLPGEFHVKGQVFFAVPPVVALHPQGTLREVDHRPGGRA